MTKTDLHRLGITLLGALIATCGLGQRAQAQDASLPDGRQLVEKYIEATGGRQIREKLTSRVVESSVKVPAANLSGTSTSYTQGDKVLVLVDLEGVGSERRGTDGLVYWEISTNTGPRIFEDKELDFWKRAFRLDSDLELDRFYESIETTGVADVDGKPAYKVVFTTHNGATETRYYDQQSGLIVKVEQVVPTLMGPLPVSSVQSDYRDVSGIKMPFKIVETLAGAQEVIVTINKIDLNVDVPAEQFELPAEIKKLQQTAKPAPATQPRG